MNPEQVTGQVRLWLAVFSGVAGALGWTWFDGLAANIAAATGPTVALGLSIWSLVAKKQGNILTMAATIKDDAGQKIVQNMELAPTAAGRALAASGVTPDNVVVAGSATGGVGMQQVKRNF